MRKPEYRKPDYARIGLFYGLAFGWVSLVALGIWLAGAGKLSFGTTLAAQLAVGFLYMPAPLAAALVVERLSGRGYLIRQTFADLRHKLPRLALTCTLATLAVYTLAIAFVLAFGNWLRLPGVGAFVFTQAEMARNIGALLGKASGTSLAGPGAPSPALLLAIGVMGGLVAGFTVNGVFAFGEEYGWRGWLMNELAPIGPVRANLVTGVLWGLWHAPLILMGFNYEPYRILGVFAMCGLTTSLSFLFWRAREYTGSVLAPAVLHGTFNGFQGFFVLLIAGRNPLVSAPVGLVAWLAIAVVAAALWGVSAGRLREPAESLGRRGGTIPPALRADEAPATTR